MIVKNCKIKRVNYCAPMMGQSAKNHMTKAIIMTYKFCTFLGFTSSLATAHVKFVCACFAQDYFFENIFTIVCLYSRLSLFHLSYTDLKNKPLYLAICLYLHTRPPYYPALKFCPKASRCVNYCYFCLFCVLRV